MTGRVASFSGAEYGNFWMNPIRICLACFRWSFISWTEEYSSPSEPILCLEMPAAYLLLSFSSISTLSSRSRFYTSIYCFMSLRALSWFANSSFSSLRLASPVSACDTLSRRTSYATFCSASSFSSSLHCSTLARSCDDSSSLVLWTSTIFLTLSWPDSTLSLMSL